MANKIRIGILGYGNLGKGVELAVRQNPTWNWRHSSQDVPPKV